MGVNVTSLKTDAGASCHNEFDRSVRVTLVADTAGIDGTEYVEDAPAATDPKGPGLNLVRDDVLSPQTNADGDNVAARGTNKGEVYVKHVDDINIATPTPNKPVALIKTSTGIEDIIEKPGVGLSLHVTLFTLSNTSSTATRADISDGADVLFSFMLAADGGGAVVPFDLPWKLTPNTALRATLGTSVTDVRITAQAFTAA